MANTKAHDYVCLLLGVNQLIVGYCYLPEFYLSAFGSVLGLLISPDWDWDGYVVVDRSTNKKRVVSKFSDIHFYESVDRHIVGKVLRRWPRFLHSYLTLYARMFEHRGISHFPIIGTVIRLCWLVFPVVLLVAFPQTIFIWWGLILADIFHIILDKN